jgi:hypothetical protein
MRLLTLIIAILLAFTSVSHSAEAAPGKKAKKAATAATGDRSLARADKNNASGKRVALVIGNGAYRHTDSMPKLANPPNDADDMAAALKRFGFEVTAKKNLTREEMDEAITNFGRRAADSDAALFYYAGHGLQVKGQNYLVPVDANIDSEAKVPYRAVNVNQLLEEMEGSKSRVNIVMLDACRNNPISGKFRSGSGRGLAPPASMPRGTVIVYATDPGNVAADGDGRNGLFTAGLLNAFKGNDLTLAGVLTHASEEVEKNSNQQQTPYINGPATVQKRFAFNMTSPSSMTDLQPSPVQPQPVEPPRKQLPGKPVVEEQNAPGAAKGFTDSITGMEFVPVPGGCFKANNTQVCLDAFRIGKYEVTQGQYKRIMGSNPSRFSSCGDDCPVEQVSWNDAQNFINRLNSQTGRRFRLPTEAEWEYACRSGGKNEEYCGGNNVDAVAWYDNNSGGKTHRIGTKQPNGLGIYDMSGNVWEWVSDWYGDTYPTGSHYPTGAPRGDNKVLRGGSWLNFDRNTRAANRNRSIPDLRDLDIIGFRLAVSED